MYRGVGIRRGRNEARRFPRLVGGQWLLGRRRIKPPDGSDAGLRWSRYGELGLLPQSRNTGASTLISVTGSSVVMAGVVAVLIGSFLLARHLMSSGVWCGFCDRQVRPWAVRKETFTCKPCKKTLPRRLSYSATAPVGHPRWRVDSGRVRVLATVGRHRK